LFDEIFEKDPPCLEGRLPMPHHIVRDRSPGTLESKLQQLGLQPWCSLEDFCSTHVSNEVLDFLGNSGETKDLGKLKAATGLGKGK
jgi:hypothetical protein